MQSVKRNDADAWLAETWFSASPLAKKHVRHSNKKGGNMKKLFVLLALSLCISVPSFGADHLVTHSAKAAGKETYKAAKSSAKETAHAGKALGKFLF